MWPVHTVHFAALSFVAYMRARYPPTYARGTSGRGVAAERSPVTTPYRVAYALCSKNVVRVNEAKLRTVVSCTKDT